MKNEYDTSIVKLEYDATCKTSNFQEFKKQLNNYCFYKYPEIGSAVLTGTLPVIPARTNLPRNASEDVSFTWKKEEERRLKRLEDRSNQLRYLYGFIMQHVNCEIENLLESLPAFIEATNHGNGLELLTVITEIISGRTTNENAIMRTKRVTDAFNQCKQGDSENLETYFTRFANTIKDITTAGVLPPLPAMQALTFIENLSDKNYLEFKTTSRNLMIYGGAYPTDLPAAIQRVREYRPLFQVPTQRVIPAATNAITTNTYCEYCKRINHEVKDCRVKMRHESQRNRERGNVDGRGRSRGRGQNPGRGTGRPKEEGPITANNRYMSSWEDNHDNLEELIGNYINQDEKYKHLNDDIVYFDSGAEKSVFKNNKLLYDIRRIPKTIQSFVLKLGTSLTSDLSATQKKLTQIYCRCAK